MSLFVLAALSFVASPVKLIFGGDIMLNGILPTSHPLAKLPKLGDAMFANLEVPLTDAKKATPNKSASELKRRDQWVLKASPLHATALGQVGVRAVTVANNHAMDFGPSGLAEMLRLLDLNDIVHAGAGGNVKEANRPQTILTSQGSRIGFLSALAFLTKPALRKCTPATAKTPGVAVISLDGRLDPAHREYLARWIARARVGHDLVVVGVHWGTERKTLPNPWQVSLGRALVDAGADVVWGHHPHVLQGAELYKGRPILYSMGNLISALPADTGLVEVTLRNGRSHLRFFPAKNVKGRYEPDNDSRPGIRRFQELCRAIQRKYPNLDSCTPALPTR